MLGAEESWVDDPRDAWWRSRRSGCRYEYLHTSSFLTQAHDLHRLRWMLADPGDPAVTNEVVGFLDDARRARSRSSAPQLVALTDALAKADARTQSLATDRGRASCRRRQRRSRVRRARISRRSSASCPMARSRRTGATCAARWRRTSRSARRRRSRISTQLRERLFAKWRARFVEVGSAANQKAIAPRCRGARRDALRAHERDAATEPRSQLLSERVAERDRQGADVRRAGRAVDVERRVPEPRAVDVLRATPATTRCSTTSRRTSTPATARTRSS